MATGGSGEARSQVAQQWPWAARGLRVTGALQGHGARQEAECEPCALGPSSSRAPAHWLLCPVFQDWHSSPGVLPQACILDNVRGTLSLGRSPRPRPCASPGAREEPSAPWSSPKTPMAPQALQPAEPALLGVHLHLPEVPARSTRGDRVQSWARACRGRDQRPGSPWAWACGRQGQGPSLARRPYGSPGPWG